MAAAARLYEELGQINRAIQLYQALPEHRLCLLSFSSILRERLALIFKRQGDYSSAIPIWEAAAQAGGLFACEELAKYYEHHALDYPQAISGLKPLLAISTQTRLPGPLKHQWQRDLEHRLERLRRKQHAAKIEMNDVRCYVFSTAHPG